MAGLAVLLAGFLVLAGPLEHVCRYADTLVARVCGFVIKSSVFTTVKEKYCTTVRRTLLYH